MQSNVSNDLAGNACHQNVMPWYLPRFLRASDYLTTPDADFTNQAPFGMCSWSMRSKLLSWQS